MEVINAMSIKKGKKTKKNTYGVFTQPIQFIPTEEKDEQWFQDNVNWLEWQGIKQISVKARRLMKNYKLAQGVIDKTDYIPDTSNDLGEMMEVLTEQHNTDTALDLKFYPLIPTVINTMVNEFAKRNTKVDYRAIDEYSYNEIMDKKINDISSALIEDAQQKMMANLLQMGMDPNSEEAQQKLDPEAIKRLPQIEDFYSKKYQTIGEQWAAKQHAIDLNRFSMDELEEIAFRDSLITDSEYWHFLMRDDDYDIEVLNPVLTFHHKSPSARYVSNSNWGGYIDMLSIADVIDKYGYLMDEEQLASLEKLHPARAARHIIQGISNDGSLYNTDQTYEENRKHGVDMNRLLSSVDNVYNDHDVVSWILGESEHSGLIHNSGMLRVSTVYWKTQRKVGHLTRIDMDGAVYTDIVDENYVVIDKPLYNTAFIKEKTSENLIYGDHIDWIWINQTVGAVKLGNNRNQFTSSTESDFEAIYLGVGRKTPGPLRFQFKGDSNLYGCKIPIEGAVFSDRNTKSFGMVDLMKPGQIGFNMVNNQIADILIDEIGSVVVLDQNALPRHSMGEDWGKANLAKAYVAMKDFSMLPLDPSIANTESATGFQHYQVLNLEQTNRLMTRIQLANYFKQQVLEVIGMNPQRMGQQIGQTNTATGVEQAVTGSYAQTEGYFIQHSDHLMPRVHKMRTDLAQFYHSTKGSVRLQGMVSPDERTNFEINGTDLLLIDLNVFCQSNASSRNVLEQLKSLAMNNNTTGASIYELGQIMQEESLGSLNTVLKKLSSKQQEAKQAEQQQAMQMHQEELAAKEKEAKMKMDHESMEKEKDRRARLLQAEIQSAGYAAQQDLNKNNQSDYVDAIDRVQKSEEYAETMGLNKEKEANRHNIAQQQVDLQRQKLDNEALKATTQLQVAAMNKNRYDKKPTN